MGRDESQNQIWDSSTCQRGWLVHCTKRTRKCRTSPTLSSSQQSTKRRAKRTRIQRWPKRKQHSKDSLEKRARRAVNRLLERAEFQNRWTLRNVSFLCNVSHTFEPQKARARENRRRCTARLAQLAKARGQRPRRARETGSERTVITRVELTSVAVAAA